MSAEGLEAIRRYVDECDELGIPAGACEECGEPWSMHPLWCARYPDDDQERLEKFATAVLGLALVSVLVSPGARTPSVLEALRAKFRRRMA